MKINLQFAKIKLKLRYFLGKAINYFNNKPKEKAYRSFIKAVTWRIIGSFSLVFVSYLFTGKFTISVALGLIDVIANLLLYFFHERIWESIAWGRSFWDHLSFADKKSRSLLKSITWRILGSASTMLISYALTGKPFVSLALTITDALLNMVEYYLHERVWDKIKFGR